MSIAIVHDVLYLNIPARRKLVLIALAEHADEEGICWPSQALIAHRASISPRKLRDHLRGLEKDGWLVTHFRQVGRGVNLYQLNVKQISEASSIEKERIKAEKEEHQLNLSETQFASPDFQDTSPDSEDIPSDFPNISPDFENTPTGPVGPIEPPGNRKGTVKETSKESSGKNKEISPSFELTEEVKEWNKQRLRGWAEMENSRSFSDRESAGLQKALEEVCAVLHQSGLLMEVWNWDFLDDDSKARWKERIEHPYATAEIPIT